MTNDLGPHSWPERLLRLSGAAQLFKQDGPGVCVTVPSLLRAISFPDRCCEFLPRLFDSRDRTTKLVRLPSCDQHDELPSPMTDLPVRSLRRPRAQQGYYLRQK